MSRLQPEDTNGDSIEITTDATTDELVEAVQLLAAECEQLRADNAELRDRVADLEADLAETQEDLAETQDDLTETKTALSEVEERLEDIESQQEASTEHRASISKDLAETNQRVSTLEDTSESGTGAEMTEVQRLEGIVETPLERAVASTDEDAEDEYTINELRAREIAMDIRTYANKTPAGWVIRAGELRKVLSAQEGERAHPETLNRTINFLNDLGKDEVKVVTRRRERRIAFSEELVERFEQASRITACVSPQPLEA
jgi:predicted nuclease with TOPRIM domain